LVKIEGQRSKEDEGLFPNGT